MIVRKRTRFDDALDTLGDIELARELEADEKMREMADRKSKSRSGMVYKSRSDQQRMEEAGEKMFTSCTFNILADETIIDKLGALRNLGDETIEILKEKRMSKAQFYSVSGVQNISGAIRRLQRQAGTEKIIIDLDTLEAAVKGEIRKNLPAGNKERALRQLELDMSRFPQRKAGVRWTVTINPRPRRTGLGLFE